MAGGNGGGADVLEGWDKSGKESGRWGVDESGINGDLRRIEGLVVWTKKFVRCRPEQAVLVHV
jgi:hypothetical protein